MPPRWDVGHLQALADGDDDVVRLFVGHFEPRLAAIARRHRIPIHDCAAVAHEAISDTVRQIRARKLRDSAKLPGFIRVVLKNKINDYWRRRGPSTLALEELPEARDLALLTAPVSDDVLIVQQILARLEPEDQLVLWLYDVEQHTLNEVGQIMHLRKSAVWERLQHARERFREEMQSAGNFAPRARLKR